MSILIEADKLVNGDRQDDYGPPHIGMNNIAKVWSVILNTEVDGAQVALCMAALKLVRQSHKPKRDNLVDVAGYAALVQMCEDARKGLDTS